MRCFVFLSLVCLSIAHASMPDFRKEAPECQEFLSDKVDLLESPQGFSQVLMPLSTFYMSTKDPFQAVLAKISDTVTKTPVSPGLMRLINSANIAVEAILKAIPEARHAVKPSYPVGDMEEGYRATQRLILDGEAAYIRDAVLIKDGVVTVVPLLKRVAKKRRDTGLPSYVPIIVRGHQFVEDWDVFSAAFASWALADVQKAPPAEALIYNKPMAEIRKVAAKLIKPFTRVTPEIYFARLQEASLEIESIWESLDVAIATQPRRNTFSSRSRYIHFIIDILKQQKSLWMIPFPPKAYERKMLKELGYGDMDKLADLKINSHEFIRVCLESGIDPHRLRRYVARSRARKENRVIILEKFSDPYVDERGQNRFILDMDFEDFSEAAFRGGVFLVGWSIENARGKELQEDIFWAETRSQKDFDQNIAQLLRLAKKSRYLAGKDFAATVYSHHEETKIKQTLGIIEDKVDNFSSAQRRSPYFRTLEKASGELVGQFIDRKDFFRRFKDIKPVDVWSFMDRFVDLLPIYRNNIITGFHTNGLKKMVEVFSTDELSVHYPEGHNGLEVQAWAGDTYETGNPTGKENSIYYVKEDVKALKVLRVPVRKYAGQEVDADFRWSAEMEEALPALERAVKLSRKVVTLGQKIELIESIVGKSIGDLPRNFLQRFWHALDMTDYLATRRVINDDPSLTDVEKARLLKQMQFDFEDDRAKALIELFAQYAPRGHENEYKESYHSALNELLEIPTVYLRATHLDKMIVLSQLEKDFPSVPKGKSLAKTLELPESWEDSFEEWCENLSGGGKLPGTWTESIAPLSRESLRELWEGLYFREMNY